MNIVVCDDDVVRRQALILFLTNSNLSGDLKIYEAQCADEVSELLIARYYDILILDIVIPKRIGEVPLAVNGSALVRKIYKTDRVHKPERIIGITGHLEEIQSYRGNLAKYGVSILEARAYSLGWESSVLNILEYIANSQGQRKKGELLEVITVHGIRTYGEWQARLKKIVIFRSLVF
jgi:CheY-like chemotaxis protein